MINRNTKGHGFERTISKFLKKFFPLSKRHLEYQSEEGHTGVDIENTDPFLIQCKRKQKIFIYTWLEEIQNKQGIPILIAKADYKKPIIVGYLDDLANLIFDPKFVSMFQSDSSCKVHCKVATDEDE